MIKAKEITHNDTWDLEVSSAQSLFDLKLRDIWRYRDLLQMFVIRDFKAFYKQTIFGPIWFFIQPLFTMGVYIFVFGNLAGLSTDSLPPALFYLAGIICWSYFQECILKTSNVLRMEASILGKVYFPRVIMPLSVVLSNLIRFGVQFILFLLAIGYYSLQGATITPSIELLLFSGFDLFPGSTRSRFRYDHLGTYNKVSRFGTVGNFWCTALHVHDDRRLPIEQPGGQIIYNH